MCLCVYVCVCMWFPGGVVVSTVCFHPTGWWFKIPPGVKGVCHSLHTLCCRNICLHGNSLNNLTIVLVALQALDHFQNTSSHVVW